MFQVDFIMGFQVKEIHNLVLIKNTEPSLTNEKIYLVFLFF